jgi:hypothetical protein
MAAVIGVGGVFFKADDPDALRTWYVRQRHSRSPQSGQV